LQEEEEEEERLYSYSLIITFEMYTSDVPDETETRKKNPFLKTYIPIKCSP
jgi:hypothetical protein